MKARGDKYKRNNRMADLSASISLLTLSINGQNVPIKRQNDRVHFKNAQFNYILFIRNSLQIQ